MNVNLANFLLTTRLSKRETQDVAAASCGVTRNTWLAWEHNGQSPTAEKLHSIAVWAGTTTEEVARLASPQSGAEKQWSVAIAGHVRQAGSDGIGYGELRHKLIALTDQELKQSLSAALRSKSIKAKGRGKLQRYYPVEENSR